MPVIKSPTEPGAAADGRRLLGFYDFELDAASGFESSVRFGEARLASSMLDGKQTAKQQREVGLDMDSSWPDPEKGDVT